MAGRKMWKFVIFVAVASVIGCTTTPLDVRYENLVQEGVNYISKGDYEQAIDVFDSAISLKEDSPDAYALRGISTIVQMLLDLNEFLERIVDIVFQSGLLSSSSGLTALQTGGLMEILNSILYPYIFGPLESAAADFQKVEDIGYFRRYIDSIPIEIKDPLVGATIFKVDLGAEWDLGDIYFVDAFITLVTGVYYLLASTDLTITNLLQFQTLLSYPALQQLGTEPVFAVSNLLATLLNAEPYMLKVNTATGPERVDTSRSLLLEAVRDVKSFIDYTKAEVISENQFITPNPDDENYFDMRFTRFDEMQRPISETVTFLIDGRISQALDDIEADLDGTPNARTSWAKDIAPLIAVTVVGILQSHLLDEIIFSLCAQADIQEECQQLLSPTFITVDLVQALLTAAIPDIFEFDLDQLFEYLATPGSDGIRGFLPAWTMHEDYSGGFPKETTDTIIMEWDCGPQLLYYTPNMTTTVPGFDRLDPGLASIACRAEALEDANGNPIPDIGHFTDKQGYPLGSTQSWVQFSPEIKNAVGTDPSIPADTIVSPLPYLIFKDPTLAGVLYVDLSGVWPNSTTNPCNPDKNLTPGEYTLPDNCELNAVIAKVAGELIKAMGDMGSLTGAPSQ